MYLKRRICVSSSLFASACSSCSASRSPIPRIAISMARIVEQHTGSEYVHVLFHLSLDSASSRVRHSANTQRRRRNEMMNNSRCRRVWESFLVKHVQGALHSEFKTGQGVANPIFNMFTKVSRVSLGHLWGISGAKSGLQGSLYCMYIHIPSHVLKKFEVSTL